MSSSEREELKPCPFCGEQDAKVYQQGGSVWDVSCTCGVVGPADITRAGAVEEWNRRAQASAEPVAWRWNTSPEFPEWAVTHDPEKAERVRRHGIGVEPLYLGASPQQAPLTDEQKPPTESRIAELVRYRFASTNRTDAFGMYTYWYEKGVLDGWEEFKRGITAAKEST